jgi:hypothetical protein
VMLHGQVTGDVLALSSMIIDCSHVEHLMSGSIRHCVV